MSRNLRDAILFVVGIAGIIYETVATGGERPTLIIAFLGMCGAPIFLRTDEASTAKAAAEGVRKKRRDPDEVDDADDDE